jgi:hypothetical protein
MLIALWLARHRLSYQPVSFDWICYTVLPLVSYASLLVAAIVLPSLGSSQERTGKISIGRFRIGVPLKASLRRALMLVATLVRLEWGDLANMTFVKNSQIVPDRFQYFCEPV